MSGLRPSARGCRGRGSTACWSRWACRRRQRACRCRWWPPACARCRRRRWPGSKRSRACCGSRRRSRCRLTRGPPWLKGCAARLFTARPARSASAGSMSWPRPAPRISLPEGRWVSSSPRGPPVRQRAQSSWSRLVSPARTPPTWPLPSSPTPRARRCRARPPSAQRGAPNPPPSAARRPRPRRSLLRVGTPRQGGGYAVEAFALEDYVARVLAGEAAAGSRPAALEALAVAVRTFAVGNRGRHQRDGFDVCTLTHCQVLRAPYAAVRDAASATAGQVLLVNGAPASVFYTASCGGRTERPSAVWPGADDPAYLPRSRTGPAVGNLDGRPRSPCRISSARSRLRAIAAHGCGISRWMAAVHQGASRACTSTG